MFSPDYELMFLCTEKRANWYLVRDLAEKIDDNPLSIRLLFKPKGLGVKYDKYGLTDKENKCVVCGTKKLEELTRHHVISLEYRKFFPKKLKINSSHDIVPICYKHHTEYERKYADKLKKELGKKYNAPYDGLKDEQYSLLHAVKSARALSIHGNKIPKSRQNELKGYIKSHFNKKRITKKFIQKILEEHSETIQIGNKWYHGKKVMEQIEDLQEFVEMWRQHFVDCMKPKFLPKYWDIKRPVDFHVYLDKLDKK